ncbi:hypothetical protein [Marinovum algicola]|uniref:hypothetical protein n=1 Tax=Marinovum algicola TaxID=42444 RepID=UPI0024BB6D48|nr:hypothetical protein [Marinovum algicola]
MTRALAILLFAAAIAFALGPFAAPGFNGFDAGQFPVPQENPPAQPAGYAFAIWGPIYVWLILGAGFQLLRRHDAPDWAPMRLPLIVSLVVGAPWLAVAQVSPLWATLLIWVMWGGAVLALLRAPVRDGAFGHWPVGLYAGWLTAASCVSLALLLAGYGVTDALLAALLTLSLAVVLAGGVILHRPDAPGFPIAVIWALIGVLVANWQDGPVAVLVVVIIGALALAGLAVLRRAQPTE